jgi:hypothetical protein
MRKKKSQPTERFQSTGPRSGSAEPKVDLKGVLSNPLKALETFPTAREPDIKFRNVPPKQRPVGEKGLFCSLLPRAR